MHMIRKTVSALEALGIRTEEGALLSSHTTFRIGGPADLAVYPASQEELIAAVRLCLEAELPYTVLGNGSDILASDDGYRGCVIFSGGLKHLSIDADAGILTAGAGVMLSSAAAAARDASLAGLAFAYGIPGTVGGAVFMNAGAYGGETADVLHEVTVYDPRKDRVRVLSSADCYFSYRDSVFQHEPLLILSADFALYAGDYAEISGDMEDYLARRKAKQPLDYPSAGSTFKRCPGHYTAQMIDEAGLKGYAIGGAQVSEKHAGFIINRGGAKASEVRALIALIRQRILEQHGVSIACEVRGLGSFEKEKE